MEVISFINAKGGVGKTTSTILIGDTLAQRGYKVLIIDLDSQGNATFSLNRESVNHKPSIFDLIKAENNLTPDLLKEAIVPTQNKNLDLLPSNQDLNSGYVKNLVDGLYIEKNKDKIKSKGIDYVFNLLEAVTLGQKQLDNRNTWLLNIVNKLTNYDFALLDCHPFNIDENITESILLASTQIMIPIRKSAYSIGGIAKIIQVAIQAAKKKGMYGLGNLNVLGILATQTDKRLVVDKGMGANLKKHFGSVLFNSSIPTNTDIQKSESNGKGLLTEVKPLARGSIAYFKVVDEMLKRMHKPLRKNDKEGI